MYDTATFGCGQGGRCGCGCGGGLAGAAARRYPAIEQVLSDYVAQQLADNRYFFLSPALNTATIRQRTFGDGATGSWGDPSPAGDWQASYGVIGPPTIGDNIAATATTIGNFFASMWGNNPAAPAAQNPDWTGVTGSWAPPPGAPPEITNLPSGLQPTVAKAAATDLFSNPLAPWIIGAAGALVLVAALMSGPRRARRRR